jgi:hypothetical protein
MFICILALAFSQKSFAEAKSSAGPRWYENNQWIQLSYIPARKKIYCKVYAQLVQATEAYKMLKELHDKGQGLQICEMDVRPGLVTKEVLIRELNNPDQPFGHGYVLAACLMGLTEIFD